MKPLNGLFFPILSTITVLVKPFTNEDGVTGPDGVKCTLNTISVKNPNNLLTFDNGHCVYSTSIDQCKTGVALFQFYDPQNVCPQERLNGPNPSQAAVPCCVHIECGPNGEGTCVNTPDSEVNDCKGALLEDEDRCPEGRSKTMCCIPSSHENVNLEYTKDQMAAVDPAPEIQSYQEGLRDDGYLFGDELWSPGVGDSGLFQDGSEGGVDCLVWGINCPG